MLAPPRSSASPNELEALIREARSRQRKRWAVATAVVGLVATSAVAGYRGLSGSTSATSRARSGPAVAVRSARKCGIHVAGPRILGQGGRTIYREPVPNGEVHPNSIPSQIQCSSSAIWIVWVNGVGMSQEGYVGARSIDRGRTWRLVFSEPFFGVKAPHELDAYLGAWTLRGARDAYFIGTCPACGYGTVSLWVTKDGGRTFRLYKVPALTGYGPTRIRVSGDAVTIGARRVERKINSRPYEIYGHKTVTIHTA